MERFVFEDRVNEEFSAATTRDTNHTSGTVEASRGVPDLADKDRDATAENKGSTGKKGEANNIIKHWTSLLASGRLASPPDNPFTWDDDLTTHAAMHARTATLISSSGTSGIPKPVQMSHYQLVAAAVTAAESFRLRRQREAQASPAVPPASSPPLCHMTQGGIVGQLSCCVLFPMFRLPVYVTSRPRFEDVLDCVIRLKLTALVTSPLFIVAMLKEEGMRRRWRECGASLRDLSLISSPVAEGTVAEFVSEWGREMAGEEGMVGLKLSGGYGMTE